MDTLPILRRAWIPGLWLLLWQGAALLVGEELLLPAPLPVLGRMAALLGEGRFLLAVLSACFPPAGAFLAPAMAAVKATPVASFVILALVWLRGENLSIFISFLMVLPLVWQNTSQGIAGADHQLLEMARVYRLSPQAVLRAVYLPAALPHLLSALRVGLGFAWKAGIAGEVLAIAPSSIGRQLHDAKTSLEMVDLFAWTGFIILLSVALERGMVALLARIFPGKEGS